MKSTIDFDSEETFVRIMAELLTEGPLAPLSADFVNIMECVNVSNALVRLSILVSTPRRSSAESSSCHNNAAILWCTSGPLMDLC